MAEEKSNKFSIVGGTAAATPVAAVDREVQDEIAALVAENSILLFMKGTPAQPQCGFSQKAAAILESYDLKFGFVNVLEDMALREGIKVFSDWPTIPQVYINGEFIGGSDTLLELHQSGELRTLIGAVRSS